MEEREREGNAYRKYTRNKGMEREKDEGRVYGGRERGRLGGEREREREGRL